MQKLNVLMREKVMGLFIFTVVMSFVYFLAIQEKGIKKSEEEQRVKFIITIEVDKGSAVSEDGKLWSGSAALKKGNCLVYPQGHTGERVFFYEDNEKDKIYIVELSRHNDLSYEKILAEGGIWRKNYNDFTELD